VYSTPKPPRKDKREIREWRKGPGWCNGGAPKMSTSGGLCAFYSSRHRVCVARGEWGGIRRRKKREGQVIDKNQFPTTQCSIPNRRVRSAGGGGQPAGINRRAGKRVAETITSPFIVVTMTAWSRIPDAKRKVEGGGKGGLGWGRGGETDFGKRTIV